MVKIAAAIRRNHPDIRFQFYSSDAADVTERRDHGSVDFAVLPEPVDTAKYEHLSLPDSARRGLLLPDACPLAGKIQKPAELPRDTLLVNSAPDRLTRPVF